MLFRDQMPRGRVSFRAGRRAVKAVTTPVTLADIKAEPALADLALVRQSRLSVVPVSEAEWTLLCAMAGTDPA